MEVVLLIDRMPLELVKETPVSNPLETLPPVMLDDPRDTVMPVPAPETLPKINPPEISRVPLELKRIPLPLGLVF